MAEPMNRFSIAVSRITATTRSSRGRFQPDRISMPLIARIVPSPLSPNQATNWPQKKASTT